MTMTDTEKGHDILTSVLMHLYPKIKAWNDTDDYFVTATFLREHRDSDKFYIPPMFNPAWYGR